MSEEQKDFKAVKVNIKASNKQGEALSRSMLYSGINIFGQLTKVYMESKQAGLASAGGAPSNMAAQQFDGDSSMMHLSQEVISIFKRLQKKDSVTKMKAFAELEMHVEEIDPESDDLQHILTFFLYHFCRIIMNEHDKKVRESAHHSLAMFIKKAKKKLGPHLKKIFSLWFCSFYDPSPEVALQAKKNFEAAFPEGKRDQVFKIAFKNFLHFASEQLQQSEDAYQESQSTDLSKAQREDIFDRVTSGVFLALANSFQFITTQTPEEQAHYKRKLIDILDLTPPSEDAKGKKVKVNYMWSFLQSKSRGRVKSACLQFIATFLLNLDKAVVEAHLQSISPLVYSIVGEDNSILQGTFWREAVFQLSKEYPQAWETINIKKSFLPQLNLTLKNSGYGAPTALYENFVRFASIFPFFHIDQYVEDKQNKASFKERCNLLREILSNVYAGLKNDESVAFHAELVSSYYETLTFLILKRIQPFVINANSNQKDVEFLYQQLKKVVQLPLEDFINNYKKFTSKVQNQSRNIRYTIPLQQAKMISNLLERDIDPGIISKLSEMMNESLTLLSDNQNSARIIKYFFKVEQIQKSRHFALEGTFLPFFRHIHSRTCEALNDLGRQNIDTAINYLELTTRMLILLNKFEVEVSSEQWQVLDGEALIEKLEGVAQKEEMAKKVLKEEDLKKFAEIKELLTRCFILLNNVKVSGNLKVFAKAFTFFFQSPSLEFRLKKHVLSPQKLYPRLSFRTFFQNLSPAAKALAFSFLQEEVLANEPGMKENWQLLEEIVGQHLKKQNSFIAEGKFEEVLRGLLEKIRGFDQNSKWIGYYFQATHSILTSKEYNDPLKLEGQQLLFDKLLIIQSSNPSYKIIWKIFEDFMKKQEQFESISLYNYCLEGLRKELKIIISPESSYDLDLFTRFTQIVKQFVGLCPKDRKQAVVEELLLQEENFSLLEHNSLPLKMFRDLFLSGGIGFDVTKMFEAAQGTKYVWLVCMLLNCKYLSSLANFIQLKKQIVIFVETELIPSLVQLVNNGHVEFIMEIARYLKKKVDEQVSSSWTHTVEFFIKKMVDPGEAYSEDEKPVLKIDQFKSVLEILAKDVIQRLAMAEGVQPENEQVLVFVKVVKILAYYLVDDESMQKLHQVSLEQIQLSLRKKSEVPTALWCLYLEIHLALREYLSQPDEAFNLELLQHFLSHIQPICHSGNSSIINTTLEYASYILNKLGLAKFTSSIGNFDFQDKFVDEMIACCHTQHLEPITYIHLLSLIRKTIGTNLISDKQKLINQVIDIAKENALSFDIKLQKLHRHLEREQATQDDDDNEELKQGNEEDDDDDDFEVTVQDFEYEMLQDLAETLLVFSAYVTPDLNENDLYLLIASGVESLQKAAFVLLKFLYENYIPTLKHSTDDEEELAQIMAEQERLQHAAGGQPEEEEKKEVVEEKKKKYRNILALRNVSEILLDMLESPPQIEQPEAEELLQTNQQIEQLISGERHEGCINQKVFGYLLAWNALLEKVEKGRIKSQVQGIFEYQQVLGALSEYLSENFELCQMLLMLLSAFLPDQKKGLGKRYGSLEEFAPEYLALEEADQASTMCVFSLVAFMRSFPSLARKFYSECDKNMQDAVMPYIKQVVSPSVLEHEIKKIEVAQSMGGELNNQLSFQLFKSTKEIFATYRKGEIEMQLKIRIPSDYPLKSVDVEVSKQIKLQETQLRKWILAIKKILQMQNGDIITAVLKWKENIERETEGVEQCFICYCVVHDVDSSLPKMPCKTCKNKFHAACIRKWFQTSNKSNCPLCQNYFF